MRDTGCGMRDAGCEIRDAGYGMRDTGCEIRDAGYGMRDTGCGIRDTGCGIKHRTEDPPHTLADLRHLDKCRQKKYVMRDASYNI